MYVTTPAVFFAKLKAKLLNPTDIHHRHCLVNGQASAPTERTTNEAVPAEGMFIRVKLLILYRVGDSNSVRQQMRFRVVAEKQSKHSQIIKWPDRASLDDDSLGIRTKLFADISASRGLHQDEKEIYDDAHNIRAKVIRQVRMPSLYQRHHPSAWSSSLYAIGVHCCLLPCLNIALFSWANYGSFFLPECGTTYRRIGPICMLWLQRHIWPSISTWKCPQHLCKTKSRGIAHSVV